MKHHWGWTILVLVVGIALGYYTGIGGMTLGKVYPKK